MEKMEYLRMALLFTVTALAVFTDLRKQKIPNLLIVIGAGGGMFCQLMMRGGTGFLLFCGGVLLPVLIFGVLYYFRMIGAGDIKLLCVIGGILGPEDGFFCIVRTILIAGILAAVIMVKRRSLLRRIRYFLDYITGYLQNRQWKNYMDGTEKSDQLGLSVPVFLSVLWYLMQHM